MPTGSAAHPVSLAAEQILAFRDEDRGPQFRYAQRCGLDVHQPGLPAAGIDARKEDGS